MSARIDHVVTSGTLSLDGQTVNVDNNVWVVGDEGECVVIDAAHDPVPILAAVGDRHVIAILCTHAHDDHVSAAPAVAAATHAPVLLHPADTPLWQLAHPHLTPDEPLTDGQTLEVAGTSIEVLHTPGHTPGGCSFSAPDLGVVFTGDTLLAGGPGATGGSYSDFPTLIASIRDRLFQLPDHTVVHPGHGESTTVGAEAPHLAEWLEPGR